MLRILIPLVVCIGFLIVAAIEDRKTYTVSLWLILGGILSGLILGWLNGPHALLVSIIGLAAGLILGMVFSFVLRMGWGDTMLYAMIGAILGPTVVLFTFALTNLFVLIRFVPSILKRRRFRLAVAPYMVLGAFAAVLWVYLL